MRLSQTNIQGKNAVSRIQGRGGFDPGRVPTVIGDYDFSKGHTLVGGNISVLVDQMGNLPDLTQTTAVDRPLWVDGDNPYGLFDGISQFMDTLAFPSELSQPNAIITVAEWVTVTAAWSFIYTGINGSKRHRLAHDVASPAKWNMVAGLNLSALPTPTAAKQIQTAIFNGASGKLYLNGGSAHMSGDVGSEGLTGLTVGAAIGGGSFWGNVKVYRIIICDGLPPDSDLDFLGNGLADLQGLTYEVLS